MFGKLLVTGVLAFAAYAVTGSVDSDPSASSTAVAQDANEQRTWRHLALSSIDQTEAKLHTKINELGIDGWELVDVANFVADGETYKTVYYFKRPG